MKQGWRFPGNECKSINLMIKGSLNQINQLIVMPDQIFCYRKEGMLQRINLHEVLFLEAADNYVRFVSLKQVDILRISLAAALSQLPEGQFIQVHRSYAIAASEINTIGKDIISFISMPEKGLPLSKSYWPNLLARINVIEPPAEDAK
jgi:DNA-binding LytR/AlgR family response regulator